MKRQRAKPRKRVRVSNYRGRRRNRELVLYILTGVLLAVGLVCLAVPLGVRFSGYLSLCLAGVCVLALFLGRWADESRTGRLCQRIFCGVLAVGLFLFLTVEGLLLFRGEQDNAALPADAVIVLGAGVNGETPSLILRSRINAAGDYLEQHPDIPVVLSGGRGPGEDISEAEAMGRALRSAGVPEERLLLEEQSASTAENFAYSKQLLQDRGVDTDTAVIAVVTSDFHCFRAHLIAQRAGLQVIDIPAEVGWPLLNANYYVREFFALGKTLLFD